LTAFHPQTDSLSERKNQWVEQYLQLVTSMDPGEWPKWLAITTAMHNNQQNATIGLLPNQVLLGYKLSLLLEQVPVMQNQTTKDRIEAMI
jgi:hypothetical protein